VNLPSLATKLQSIGIMDKPFNALSRDEAVAMVEACWGIMEPTDARGLPYWRERAGGRELVFPCDVVAAFMERPGEDSWIHLYRVLEAMGATDDDRRRYLGPDWLERMHKRTQFTQTPRCPVCGGAVTKEKAA